MLESETKKMEEKLELVKKMMELEKQKRSQVMKSTTGGGGTIWRGATTKQNIKGYSDQVLTQHKKQQPNLPPTTVVTNVNSQAAKRPLNAGTSSASNLRRVPSSQGSRRAGSKTGQRQNA